METDGHDPTITTDSINSSFVGDYFTFTTADIPLKAEREEDGRGQSRIGAKITVKADEFSNHVTITQDTEAHNVIRQEYEDVTNRGSDAPYIPPSNDFRTGTLTLPDASDNETIPSSDPDNPWQGDQGYWIFRNIAEQELEDMAETGRDRMVNGQRFGDMISGEFYEINSHFRAPAFNQEVGPNGGVGDSHHTLGIAVDFDGQAQPYHYLLEGYSGWNDRNEALRDFLRNQSQNEEDIQIENEGAPSQHIHMEWIDQNAP